MNTKVLTPLLAFLPIIALADEGMWTVDNFPVAAVAEKYDVSISEQ